MVCFVTKSNFFTDKLVSYLANSPWTYVLNIRALSTPEEIEPEDLYFSFFFSLCFFISFFSQNISIVSDFTPNLRRFTGIDNAQLFST